MAFLSTVFLFTKAGAQNQMPDSGFLQRIIDSTIDFARVGLQKNSGLFIGTEYKGYDRRIQGHPYFASDSIAKGSVFFDGILYKNVPLLYDILVDEIILSGHSQTIPIKLLKLKVHYFYLNEELFVKLEGDSLNGSLVPGFYNLLYQDKVSVLAKRKKQILESRKDEDDVRFKQYDEYYIRKNNVLYKVDNNRSFLEVFNDKKDDLRQYQRRNNIKYKKDPANALVKTVAHYNKLLN